MILGLLSLPDLLDTQIQPDSTQKEPVPQEDWQTDYVNAAGEQLNDYSQFTGNTDYYQYDNALIANAADSIAARSRNSKDAMEKTLAFVFENVQYVVGEPDSACFNGVAPKILASGRGQCDTQSIVVIAILRKMGIATAPVGGCIKSSQSCLLQSFFLGAFEGVGVAKTPKFTVLDPDREPGVSRTEVSMFSRQGGLHAYVTAWSDEDGWITLEPTAGRLADTKCWDYHVELFPADNNKREFCITQNRNYAIACRDGDIASMNANGVGLINDMNPDVS